MSVHSETNRNAVLDSLDALPKVKRRIVELLLANPNGLTRHEIGERLGLPLSTVCGRVTELEKDYWVFSTEETRQTQYGKPATIVRVRSSEKPIQQQFSF